MRIGLDYRPALVNREGIGRYTRELVRALHGLNFDPNLGLFGYTLRSPRYSKSDLGLEQSRAELLRMRLPSRILPDIVEPGTRLGPIRSEIAASSPERMSAGSYCFL